MENNITKDIMESILHYDPDTGIFTWINCIKKKLNGMEAGGKNKSGYMLIKINGIKYYAHRLAFMIMIGDFPKNNVDHIDGNKVNNKWKNLREATFSENSFNSKLRNDNTSGCKCVSFHIRNKKWQVSITLNGKRKHYGFFDSKNDAEKKAISVMKYERGEFFRLA